jgi:hypothetical protein
MADPAVMPSCYVGRPDSAYGDCVRVEVLSDHPGDLLAKAVRDRGLAAGQADGIAAKLGRERDKARAERRWLTWVRLIFAVRRARRAARVRQAMSATPTDQEQALRAGGDAEQRAADDLGAALADEWLLFRGYRNGRGEIDGLLLGPRGIFAYEVKYVNATVDIHGDDWRAAKFDKYGNQVEARAPMTDRGGRSPSRQLNDPASALADWLRRNGHQASIKRVVLLTHHNAQVGTSRGATVQVVMSARGLLRLVERSPVTLRAGQQAEIAELIRRDHRHCAERRGKAGRR